MLEKVDLSKKVDKKTYKLIKAELGERLSALQRKLKEEKIPVVIVFEGFEAAGRGVQINRLIQPLDPRGFEVYADRKPGKEEKLRPFLWRYWTKTPAEGEIAVFDKSWYDKVTIERFDKELEDQEIAAAFDDILSFERQLTDGGIVVIKLFLYISKEEQKKRFQKLEQRKDTDWRVDKKSWKRNKQYDRYRTMNEEMLQRTDVGYAPWTIIEATDKNYAAMKCMAVVADRLQYEVDQRAVRKQGFTNLVSDAKPLERFKNGALSGVDLSIEIDPKDYKKELNKLQQKLEYLHNELYRLRIPVVIGFEGWDAAGKGGAIRRLTSHLDPRGYRVTPIAAPNDEERQHHYLWRFWNRMPKAGHIAIFDRTWYGRVMVERIEGFCTEEDWRRAYQEINEMEAHMANYGAVILKFWLHIDKDEQERRFKERMENPARQWKITDEDWRNREKWEEYEMAVNEMLVRTSTTYAPWTIVEGNSKYYARVKVLRTVVEALEERVKAVKKDKH